MLPAMAKADLARHLESAQAQHQQDLTLGAGWVELPTALSRKYPHAGREWAWRGLPGHALLRGPRHRPAAPPPPPRIRASAGGERRGPRRRDRQAGHVPHFPPLVCHPPAGGEPRHLHRSGAARPPGRQHHDDLHARSQSGPGWSPEPGRPDVPVMSLSFQQRYQISERDIRQCLAVYHGTRGGGPSQGGGNSGVPLPRRARWP